MYVRVLLPFSQFFIVLNITFYNHIIAAIVDCLHYTVTKQHKKTVFNVKPLGYCSFVYPQNASRICIRLLQKKMRTRDEPTHIVIQ